MPGADRHSKRLSRLLALLCGKLCLTIYVIDLHVRTFSRAAKFVLVHCIPWPSAFFSSPKHDNFNALLGGTVAPTASICLHPRP